MINKFFKKSEILAIKQLTRYKRHLEYNFYFSDTQEVQEVQEVQEEH